METTQIPLDGRMIPLSIRRHRRARRISLRLSPARDGIVMTLPMRASVESGMRFFSDKAQWVLSNVDENAAIPLEDGMLIPLLGADYRIRRRDGRGVSHLAAGELIVFGAAQFTSRRVRDFLKKHLRGICLERAAAMAQQLGKKVSDVRIRHMGSRWGSCSAGGKLTFHWQLVFAPMEVALYLVAHEVAHLKEMNHSDRFWRTVAQLCPNAETPRRWLKKHGHTLHRFGR